MTLPSLRPGCPRCGGTRVSQQLAVFGRRDRPARERVLLATCVACGHCWSEALTAPPRDAAHGVPEGSDS
ncbi:hypothetical protein [Roseisolibacter sp. H3M3-2]|uniref:hypothetical protein n=1 Tax=Roseisolibacter sp. H3M3-2 TaxID=3031323 RepID=UPI0023D97AAA|nr:hypothetical protein [Roseisolibacter sp. H3M3-2]MDF1503056.1 hypothetical protein [Roseisolibacter sp. H3M3-2]